MEIDADPRGPVSLSPRPQMRASGAISLSIDPESDLESSGHSAIHPTVTNTLRMPRELRAFRLSLSSDEDVDGDEEPYNERMGGKTVRWALPPSPMYSAPLSAIGFWDRRHIGLIVSVAFASLLTSWLKRGVLTLMKRELHLHAYQQDAAEVLLMLPWSCSFILGFCSDIFPIRGSHRKAYMVLGWMFTSLALLCMALLQHFDTPGRPEETDTPLGVVNLYLFLLGAACFGEIASVIIAEAYVVALAKREDFEERGRVVAAFLILQLGCELLGQIAVYDIVWREDILASLSLGCAAQVLFLFSLVPIPTLIWCFNDHLDGYSKSVGQTDVEYLTFPSPRITASSRSDAEEVGSSAVTSWIEPRQPLCDAVRKISHHWATLWHTLENRATWNVVRFLCFFVFFTEFALRYTNLVLDDWSGVTGVTDAETDIFVELLYVGAVVVWRVAFMNRSWKTLAAIALFGVYLVPQFVYFSLLIFVPAMRGVTTLYSFVKALRGFLRGTVLVLEIAAIVEIAPPGAEGVVLGALASVATVMRLVAATFSDMIGYLFGTQVLLARTVGHSGSGSGSREAYDYQADETWIVFVALVLCSTIRLLASIGIFCLPRQKEELLDALLEGVQHPKPRYAWSILGLLAVSLAIAAALNALVVTPETMCLRAFGGRGC